MSYVSPHKVFAFLVNSYGTVAIFVYVMIAISQLRLRARLERESPGRLRVRMWGYPYLTYSTSHSDSMNALTSTKVHAGRIDAKNSP